MTLKYVTLMSSLPPIGQLFASKQTPISRLQLEERLKLLDEEDTTRLKRIVNLIAWSHQPLERTDSQFVAEANLFLAEVRNPTLQEIITYRLNIRTILAALRRRYRGESEPPDDQAWGVGSWVKYIERHWHEPGFRLEVMFPWVTQANQLLNSNDSIGLERLQFELNWKMLDRLGAQHYFDFEAVVIYLMRWSLVDRWTRYNPEVALQQFRQLVTQGQGQFSSLF